MTIAVTGASGQLGRRVIARLKDKVPAAGIVALARTPAKAADLGVAVREADYARPETLGSLAGVDTLLLISLSGIGPRAAQHRNVIDAARTAGVTRIVYTSLLHADTSPLDLASEHRRTEAELKASGIAFTILRNGWYTENYAQTVRQALTTGAFAGSAGEARLGGVPRIDFAEAAVAVLTGDGHAGKTYELAGDTHWNYGEFAAAITEAAGTPVTYQDVSAPQHRELLVAAGLPEPVADMLVDADRGIRDGELSTTTGDLSALIGRPTTPLADAVAALVKN